MGPNISCQGHGGSRRNKRNHGAEDSSPFVGFVPARHALTGSTGGTGPGRGPAGPHLYFQPRVEPPSAPQQPHRSLRRARRLIGQSSGCQPTTSRQAYNQPFDVENQPDPSAALAADRAGGGFSHSQDTEMIDTSDLQTLSQSSQSHKKIKLEMEIDAVDGSFSGRLVLDDQPLHGGPHSTAGPSSLLMNIPSRICAICQEQIHTTVEQAYSHAREQQMSLEFGRQPNLFEEIQLDFDRKEARYLETLKRELMTDIGFIDFNKIVGFEKEIRAIKEEIGNRHRYPVLFDGLRKFTATGVLISGAEGNGKTTMARIIANDMGVAQYINVQPYYFDTEDKYERLIGIFRLARRTQPAVIIFDAADQSNKAHPIVGPQNDYFQQLFLNEFLTSVQAADQIVVIITMNHCSHNIPARILACFEHKIHLKLPDAYERKALIGLYMRDTNNALSGINFQRLALKTNGFSRGKLRTLCRKASDIAALEVAAQYAAGDLPHDVTPRARAVTYNDFKLAMKKLAHNGANAGDDSSSSSSNSSSDTSWTPMAQDEEETEEETEDVTGNMSEVD